MKKIVCIALTLVMLFSCFIVSNAASASSPITERPDIQVFINGVKGDYTNNPIIVNGRTLLPLRELLTNLGVANDDQHIIWDGIEKSVTVIKDSVKLYLKVGDTNAKVNDENVTIDAAPVNYNSRVYIPAKFVAEALGMGVTWDNDTKTVQIQSDTEIKSADGKFSITIPGNWEEANDINEDADLQAECNNGDEIMVALIESKLDFTSFENWKNIIVQNYSESFENAQISAPANITVNGNPAEQYVITATYEEVNVKILLTCIKGTDYYAQIMCTSSVSVYNDYEKDFKQITNSIKGL